MTGKTPMSTNTEAARHAVEYLADGVCAATMCVCGGSAERENRGTETMVVCLRSGEVIDSWFPADGT